MASQNSPHRQWSAIQLACISGICKLLWICSLDQQPKAFTQQWTSRKEIQTIKSMLKQSSELFSSFFVSIHLLSWCALSPSRLLMGRKSRTTIPPTSPLEPGWSYLIIFGQIDKSWKEGRERLHDTSTEQKNSLPLMREIA